MRHREARVEISSTWLMAVAGLLAALSALLPVVRLRHLEPWAFVAVRPWVPSSWVHAFDALLDGPGTFRVLVLTSVGVALLANGLWLLSRQHRVGRLAWVPRWVAWAACGGALGLAWWGTATQLHEHGIGPGVRTAWLQQGIAGQAGLHIAVVACVGGAGLRGSKEVEARARQVSVLAGALLLLAFLPIPEMRGPTWSDALRHGVGQGGFSASTALLISLIVLPLLAFVIWLGGESGKTAQRVVRGLGVLLLWVLLPASLWEVCHDIQAMDALHVPGRIAAAARLQLVLTAATLVAWAGLRRGIAGVQGPSTWGRVFDPRNPDAASHHRETP